jgi:hypothetical protein
VAAEIAFVRTLSEILTAGIAITAFSLLIYALTFNLKVQVARSFALLLVCVVIWSTAEAIGGAASRVWEIEFWLKIQWIGIVFLPAIYLHFSDAILAMTGKPSRGRRSWTVRVAYFLSVLFLAAIPSGKLAGPLVLQSPAAYLKPTIVTDLFLIYNGLGLILSWYNFLRAYRRTTTSASRRRIGYLLAGSLAPTIGAFPFLPYSPLFSNQHPLVFWLVAVAANIIVGTLIVVMAYSVAFFGVAWPDRVVRARLFKWIMRGPFTASLTLGVVTLVRRGGMVLGWNYEALAPIVMAATILLSEHLITVLSPLAERWLFYGNDRKELEALDRLESQLVTRNDLKQFLEMVLAATSDLLQAAGGYMIAFDGEESELVLTTGKTRFEQQNGDTTIPRDALQSIPHHTGDVHTFQWGGDMLIPLFNGTPEKPEMTGLMGISEAERTQLDREQMHSFALLVERAALAMRDRKVQQQIFNSVESLSSQVDLIQRLRAAGRYDREGVLASEESLAEEEPLTLWVKEALSHYWGGPRLTASPLIRYKVVQDALKEYDGNQANAMRSILRRAIESVRPEGERRFTGEWILYNILDMKFVEGKKVREIAMRLAMSEADLYRKQRVAVEVVARAIGEMETQAISHNADSEN